MSAVLSEFHEQWPDFFVEFRFHLTQKLIQLGNVHIGQFRNVLAGNLNDSASRFKRAP